VKREKLLEKVTSTGAIFVRRGKKHDIYENPRTHEYTQIPRHSDINEFTAMGI
jgi:hypothetical protein